MRLTEISYGGALPVQGYGPGFFRVGGKVHRGGLLLMPSGVAAWSGYDVVPATEPRVIDLLLVGTGPEIAPLPTAFRAALEAAGIGVEIMATPTAARSYNMLLAEGRRVGAALIPV